MEHEKYTAKFLTGFARLFGVLCLISAIAFLVSAVADASERVFFALLSAGLLVAGVAFLRVKPMTPTDLERVRSLRK